MNLKISRFGRWPRLNIEASAKAADVAKLHFLDLTIYFFFLASQNDSDGRLRKEARYGIRRKKLQRQTREPGSPFD